MRLPTAAQHRPVRFNMTPMIDVVFLLIVFFLVSSHLARQETQFELELPTASTGEQVLEQERPRVTINLLDEGRLLLASTPVDPAELQARLGHELANSGRDLEVRIRGDRRVPYRSVEPVLLACAKAGVWNVTFAVIQED